MATIGIFKINRLARPTICDIFELSACIFAIIQYPKILRGCNENRDA
jgi:hypothetical protein